MTHKYFYKYFTINEILYSSIINNELYFSNPRNFNDPFDSYPRFKLTENIEKLKAFYCFIQKKVRDIIPFINASELDRKRLQQYNTLLNTFNQLNISTGELYANEIENLDDKLTELCAFYSHNHIFESLLDKDLEFLQVKMYYDYIFLTIDKDKIGISCGSLNPTCPLMWGHYGNNHRGVCIRYEFESDISYDKNVSLDILKVKYSDAPIDIFNYSIEELEQLKFEILANKYSKWEYENEIRIIKQGQGLLKINKENISELIFGCRSTSKDRYSIIKLFASLGYKIEKLHLATRLPSQYELSIEEMQMKDIAGSGIYIDEMNLKRSCVRKPSNY